MTITAQAGTRPNATKRDERGDDDEFVGERVEELAGDRDEVPPAGDPAVEEVGGAGDREQDRRPVATERRRVGPEESRSTRGSCLSAPA